MVLLQVVRWCRHAPAPLEPHLLTGDSHLVSVVVIFIFVVCVYDRRKQAYELELQEIQKAEDEYRRQQQMQDRLYKEDEELKMKEQEVEERRCGVTV